jgi:hypothetical protein
MGSGLVTGSNQVPESGDIKPDKITKYFDNNLKPKQLVWAFPMSENLWFLWVFPTKSI